MECGGPPPRFMPEEGEIGYAGLQPDVS